MSRMFDRLEANQLAVGSIFLTHGPEWIELAGQVGFDWACIDMMYGGVDWNDAANMVRAAHLFNVSPWIRLQGYPWEGKPDSRHIADVARAFSVGAEVVVFSAEQPDEVEHVLKVQRDWHERVYLYRSESDSPDYEKLLGEVERRRWVAPLLESPGAMRRIGEFMAIDGLRAVWLGIGDLSRYLGHPGEWEHPEIREFIGKTGALGKRHGVQVICNVGPRRYGQTPESIRKSATVLFELGVHVMVVPYFTLVVHSFYSELCTLLRTVSPGSSA